MYLVSIIVPVYNGQSVIERCIQSIFTQTYKNYELIIINDGSCDKTQEICIAMCNGNSKCKIITIQNGGVSNARNIGITNANGELIVFVDSDDFVSPLYLERLVINFEEGKFVLCKYHKVTEKRYKKEVKITKPGDIKKMDKDNLAEIYLSSLFCQPWNKVYSREVILQHQIKFNIELSIGEDLFFNLEYLNYCNEFIVIDEKLYYYFFNISGLNATLSQGSKYLDLFTKQCVAINQYLTNILQVSVRDLDEFRYHYFMVYINKIRIMRKTHKDQKFLTQALSRKELILTITYLRNRKILDSISCAMLHKGYVQFVYYFIKIKRKIIKEVMINIIQKNLKYKPSQNQNFLF